MIIYELYRGRYKELWITVIKDSSPYMAGQNEKIRFVIAGADGVAVLEKELTSADYDETLEKYKLTLSSAETDIPVGRYFFDCTFIDSDGEKHPVSSGRIIVKETFA